MRSGWEMMRMRSHWEWSQTRSRRFKKPSYLKRCTDDDDGHSSFPSALILRDMCNKSRRKHCSYSHFMILSDQRMQLRLNWFEGEAFLANNRWYSTSIQSAVEWSVYYHRILLLVMMIAVDLSCLQQHRDIGCGGGGGRRRAEMKENSSCWWKWKHGTWWWEDESAVLAFRLSGIRLGPSDFHLSGVRRRQQARTATTKCVCLASEDLDK